MSQDPSFEGRYDESDGAPPAEPDAEALREGRPREILICPYAWTEVVA
jgi:hypothetical protein